MKKRLIKRTVLTIALILNVSYVSYAQEKELETSKTEISVEIDPATFVLSGYGIHLRLKPKNSQHFLIGIGAYAMDMPDVLVDFNENNKEKGWDVRLNQGYGLFGEYHFAEVNKKWFVGTQLSLQEYKIENESIEGSEKFSNILIMAYTGYTWKLFNSDFYIKPWAGVGYTSKVSGSNTLGNLEYDISPIMMFATLHIGYTF